MSEDEVIRIVLDTIEEMRAHFVPNPQTRYKTSKGNMAFNSLKVHVFRMYNHTEIEIWMDEDIAPYVVYTNEPWLSPKWNGKKNPNEGWWEKFLNTLMTKVNEKVEGELTFQEK